MDQFAHGFLDVDFWHHRGYSSFQAFKTSFGIFRDGQTATGQKFKTCVAYVNLDHLRKLLLPHSSRILKKDALDLPPKIYQHIRFELTPEQREMYNQVQEMLYAEVKDGDIEGLMTAELPITNVLRLYQISCGYIPFMEDNEGEPKEHVHTFKENPRLEEAVKFLKNRTAKTVVWCRFRRDIDLLCAALGPSARRYDGTIDNDTRATNKQSFLKGDTQFIVPQIQAMARGHTLNIAEDVMYYSNDSRLRLRRQSEDRTHRGIMKHSVMYTDMLASDTVDEKRIKALRQKLKTAETILGDNQ